MRLYNIGGYNMVRKILDCPERPQAKDNVTELNLTIEFISPLFGGSSEKGKNDIRESSIRGQLRFWWRATIGAGYNSVKEMRGKEGEIFGNTDKASNVIIKIINRIKRSEKNFVSFPTKQNGKSDMKYSYILFPFRDQKIDGLMNITFDLQVKILKEEFVDDVKKTLKAWINFGGLGARTRRGLGSLYCEEYAFKDINELNLFIKQIQSSKSISFPSINKMFYAKGGDWETGTKLLKNFRQEEFIGRRKGQGLDRNNKPKKYGRSYWPEPDTIGSVIWRKDTHKKRNTDENCFPRAEFGLPIIVDFRDGLEPPTMQIVPVVEENGKEVVKERFASPLIIKNIKLKNNDIYQIVILLNGIKSLKGVKLDLLIKKVKDIEKVKEDIDKKLSILSKEQIGWVPEVRQKINQIYTKISELSKMQKEIEKSKVENLELHKKLNEQIVKPKDTVLEILSKKPKEQIWNLKNLLLDLDKKRMELVQKALKKFLEEELKTYYPIEWTPSTNNGFQNKNLNNLKIKETPLTINGSAIEGFIEFIKKNGFTEINGGAR